MLYTTRAIMKTYTKTICLGKKQFKNLFLKLNLTKKNKTMAMTIYLKNKSLNFSLLQKTREAQT
jgi:hypothetical protein